MKRLPLICTLLGLWVVACGTSAGLAATADAPSKAIKPASAASAQSSPTTQTTPPTAVPNDLLPAERATVWNPGLRGEGGIPQRSEICSTVAPKGQDLDDWENIQVAINRCPSGKVVQLREGTFLINGGNFLLINKAITLRGAGAGRTTLAKTDGAKPNRQAGAKPSPLIIVGPYRWASTPEVGRTSNLVSDAVKGRYTVEVADPANFRAGQIVLLDEESGAGWQKDPQERGQIWAAPDWRVVWRKHNPHIPFADDFGADAFPSTPGSAGTWFSRPDRPTAELKQIASVTGSTLKFTTPIHITYRVFHAAQLYQFQTPHVVGAGVEDLTLVGGDEGNLKFQRAAKSWARNVESTVWHGEGFSINGSHRIELRDFYVHDAAWAQPGGGGYAISLAGGSSEVLIENGIAVRANKLMVARSSGAGSVVGYNYMDMGYINTNGNWIEVGLNASHMVGSHSVLFEGNYGHNADSDNTHGNSILHTFFRNHLACVRAPFQNQAGGMVDDAKQAGNAPKRCAGLMAYSYWMSFIGNVLGLPGQMRGWRYETSFPRGGPGIWMLGWDDVKPYPVDSKVSETTIRHGNFDYVTQEVKWDPALPQRRLPDSLYLTEKPAFFNAGRGYNWPWVDPVGSTKLHVLPAKARYDAGTPFLQP